MTSCFLSLIFTLNRYRYFTIRTELNVISYRTIKYDIFVPLIFTHSGSQRSMLWIDNVCWNKQLIFGHYFYLLYICKLFWQLKSAVAHEYCATFKHRKVFLVSWRVGGVPLSEKTWTEGWAKISNINLDQITSRGRDQIWMFSYTKREKILRKV